MDVITLTRVSEGLDLMFSDHCWGRGTKGACHLSSELEKMGLDCGAYTLILEET